MHLCLQILYIVKALAAHTDEPNRINKFHKVELVFGFHDATPHRFEIDVISTDARSYDVTVVCVYLYNDIVRRCFGIINMHLSKPP